VTPPNFPPRPEQRLRLASPPESMAPEAGSALLLDVAASLESLRQEHRAEADEVAAWCVRHDAADARRDLAIERIEGGVLEAIAIAQRVEKRQKDDAASLRQSSSDLERVTSDHSTDLLRIRTLVAPLMAEASREGSARASRQVGAFGAIATTAAVVAPHIPWGEIFAALHRVVGG
jgi:hypothetical protein